MKYPPGSGASTAAAAPKKQMPPVSDAVALEAAQWFFLLASADATERDRARWARWHATQPAHAAAWKCAQRVGETFAVLPSGLMASTLENGPRTAGPGQNEMPQSGNSADSQTIDQRRRRAIKTMALLVAAGPAGWLGWQQVQGPTRALLASSRTTTGERREITLPDGSLIQLDTASAIDIAFDDSQRTVLLRSGAIHVQTAVDPHPAHRPFAVVTAQGRLRALGTRFTVRQEPGLTQVAVLQGAVEASPVEGGGRSLVLKAGEQAGMTESEVANVGSASPQADSWTKGLLSVHDMPLHDFAQELSRYRSGLLRCDPEVAGLRISGIFQLRDTDAVLASLPDVLPVAVRYRSRYWVTLVAARD